MREFFKGWRRKVGVVTLVMALAVLIALVRSLFVLDTIDIRYSGVGFGLKSSCGFVEYDSNWRVDGNSDASRRAFEWHSVKFTTPGGNRPTQQLRFYWSFQHSTDGMRLLDVGFPYWSLIAPLTLLSAYLLLSKPRQTKPQSEPASTTGESHA